MIEIVIDKEILLEFLLLHTPCTKDEVQLILLNSLSNENNKIKLSEKLLNYYELFFKEEDPNIYYLYTEFIKRFLEEKRFVVIPEGTSISESEEMKYCFNHEVQDFTFCLLYKQVPSLISSFPNNVTVINEVKKPNNNWVILSLLSNQDINLNYSHFESQEELNFFFKKLFNISNRKKELFIIDSYFNVGVNVVLNQIKSSKSKIKCFKRLKEGEDKAFIINNLKDFFGTRRTSVKFSKDTSLVHERKIGLNNLILESTHDFAEVNLRNSNWNLYFQICDEKKSLFDKNISRYN